jgi:hypothetical protein
MSREKKQNWYKNPRKYHFIYKTTCSVNGKYYYGMHSTDNLEDGYLGSGTKLWHSIKKHGIENFKIEILEFCLDRESLKQREAELITEEMLNDPMCMNLKLGGEGGWNLYARERSNQSELGRLKGRKGGISFTSKHREFNESRFRNVSKRLWECNREQMTDYARNANKCSTTKEAIEKRKATFESINHQQGSKNSQYGTCWIFHEEFGNKKCSKEEVNDYIEKGWTKGRRIKPDEAPFHRTVYGNRCTIDASQVP